MSDESYTSVPASIGSFKAVIRTKDALGTETVTEISTHTCTMAELGRDESSLDQAKFYAPETPDTSTKLAKYASNL